MSLLTDWSAIVGPELAAYTCPEKLSWPRQTFEDPDESPNTPRKSSPPKRASGKRSGGKSRRGITLKLRVESHRALDVQYSLGDIIGRINTYFGYRAVTDVRLVQGPVNKEPITPAAVHDHIKCESKKPLADLSTIKDEGLRAALARLDEARRQ